MRRAAGGLLAAALLALPGCGDADSAPAAGLPTAGGAETVAASGGELAWVAMPEAYDVDGLPGDRVLQGKVRNETGKPIDLRVDEVDVSDADGKPLEISVRFAQAFGHALYGPGGPPPPLVASRYDQARLGERVTVANGESQPITLAWREKKGTPADRVELSGYELELPR